MSNLLVWSLIAGGILGVVGVVWDRVRKPGPAHDAEAQQARGEGHVANHGQPTEADQPLCHCGLNPEWWCKQGHNDDPVCPLSVHRQDTQFDSSMSDLFETDSSFDHDDPFR